jgi:UDP-N-acetyl-D-galactosamine dehydrogenase
MIYEKITSKQTSVALIGLGYVGLPIALAFAKKTKVIGFDISEEKIKLLKQNIDPSNEVESKDFENCDILFTNQLDDLRQATFFIVAVPTPIDNSLNPDLKPLLSASKSVGKVLKKGDYVVYESTVYPGCTEEDCIPVLEKESGLKFNVDFKVGYSPERINPGDKEHTLAKITKVVAGCDAESLENIAKTYELVVEAGVHRTSSIKVAEAAKIIENTQRDLNIALMNELSMIFNKLNINTYEVLEAASTKWNFLKFTPGLVGGHCIGVDPYYLTYKSKQLGHNPNVILSGRHTNDNMGAYIAQQTIKHMVRNGKNINALKVLVMGITFKENVKDIRNSKVIDIIKELQDFHIQVDVIDPQADSHEVKEEYNISLCENPSNNYDAIIVAVHHKEYLSLTEKDLQEKGKPEAILIDVKGIFRNKIKNMQYWSL